MSRRREAADLARALALSTQEAHIARCIDPNTLSSPLGTGKGGDGGGSTIDSHEMEMRLVDAGGGDLGVDPRLFPGRPTSSVEVLSTGESGSGQGSSGSSGIRETGERSTIEQAISTVQMSNISAIQPFTPTDAGRGAMVPNSSALQPYIPRARHTPAQPSSSHSANPPSSFPMAPPRVSSTEKSSSAALASDTASSRPLFSPTQGSLLNGLISGAPVTASNGEYAVGPSVKHQYSRSGTRETPTGPSRRPYVDLGRPSPVLNPAAPISPDPAPRPRTSRAMIESDEADEDMTEEEEEELESLETPKAHPVRPFKSLLDDGETSGSKPQRDTPGPSRVKMPPPDRTPVRTTPRQAVPPSSPDPLLIQAPKPRSKSSRQVTSSIPEPAGTGSTTNAKSGSKAKSSSRPEINAVPERRASSRVKDQEAKEEAAKAKAEAETLERRRKRREEKDKQAREEAAKAEAAKEEEKVQRSETRQQAGGRETRGVAKTPARDQGMVVERGQSAAKHASGRPAIVVSDDEDDEEGEERADQTTVPQSATTPTGAAAASVPVRTSTDATPSATSTAALLNRSPGKASSSLAEVVVVTADPLVVEPAQSTDALDESYSQTVQAGPSRQRSNAVPIEAATQGASISPVKRSAGKKAGGKAKVAPRGKSAKATQRASEPAGASPVNRERKEDTAPPVPLPTAKAAKVGAKKRRLIDDDDEDDEEGDAVVPPPQLDEPISESAVSPVKTSLASASPAKSRSASPVVDTRLPARPPLAAVPSRLGNMATSSPRPSPGPKDERGTPLRPGGIQFKTERNDLASVLSKFPGSRFAGMSRRLKIAPLHAKIGPPKKELAPAPKKPEKRKKGESDDEEDEDEEDEEEDGYDAEGVEGGPREARKKRKREKGMEWFMVED